MVTLPIFILLKEAEYQVQNEQTLHKEIKHERIYIRGAERGIISIDINIVSWCQNQHKIKYFLPLGLLWDYVFIELLRERFILCCDILLVYVDLFLRFWGFVMNILRGTAIVFENFIILQRIDGRLKWTVFFLLSLLFWQKGHSIQLGLLCITLTK